MSSFEAMLGSEPFAVQQTRWSLGLKRWQSQLFATIQPGGLINFPHERSSTARKLRGSRQKSVVIITPAAYPRLGEQALVEMIQTGITDQLKKDPNVDCRFESSDADRFSLSRSSCHRPKLQSRKSSRVTFHPYVESTLKSGHSRELPT